MKRVSALVLVCFLPGLTLFRTAGQNSLLGSGRGIDHVGVAVQDVATAIATFRDGLGFDAQRGGRHSMGTENGAVLFEDHTYLELITYYDRQKKDGAELSDFLDKRGEGAAFLAIDVSSAQRTANFLRSRRFEVSGPTGGTILHGGEKDRPPGQWWTVEFNEGVLAPGHRTISLPIFFIEYDVKGVEKWLQEAGEDWGHPHPNTARGLRSVWMAVGDVNKVARALEPAGFRAGRELEVPNFGAKGREIRAGRGVILLLQPQSARGRVASFLRERGESILGVSIEVGSLSVARGILESRTKQEFVPYDGIYGQSVLVPPSLTHGVWLEMFDK